MVNNKQRVNTYFIYDIAYSILTIDCLLIAIDAHMFTHNGYAPGTSAQGAVGRRLRGPARRTYVHQWQSTGNAQHAILHIASHMCDKFPRTSQRFQDMQKSHTYNCVQHRKIV